MRLPRAGGVPTRVRTDFLTDEGKAVLVAIERAELAARGSYEGRTLDA
jgi:hypothetical protein